MTAAAVPRPAALPRAFGLLPLVLAVLLVFTAIAYPLTSSAGRDAVTWTIVLLGAAVSVSHAAVAHGMRTGAGVLAVVVLTAVAFEAVGLATGVPYGEYRYGPALGPTVLGVPLLVPLAWLMMAWPSRLLAARLVSGRVSRVLVGAGVLAAWDVVLDPQMVQAGYWLWEHPRPGLPGIDTVPLTNLAGWLLAGTVVMALLEVLVARTELPASPRIGPAAPLVVLAWMTLGGALAHAGWLDLPGSAAWGAALAVPVLVTLVVRRMHR